MITLHINGWTPPAIAVAITLGEKELEYQTVSHAWSETADALSEFAGYAELTNGLEGEFPILVDGATPVSDSYFVLEYLDDKYPEPALKPDGAYGQWQVEALARFVGERALPAVATLGVAARMEVPQAAMQALADAELLTPERRQAWAQLTSPPDDELIGESNRKVALLFERLDDLLTQADADWLLGERFTLSDIAAFVLAHPFIGGILEPVEGISAGVRAWHDRMLKRPAVAAALAYAEMEFLPGPEHSRWG